jgi:hypothetical protein
MKQLKTNGILVKKEANIVQINIKHLNYLSLPLDRKLESRLFN